MFVMNSAPDDLQWSVYRRSHLLYEHVVKMKIVKFDIKFLEFDRRVDHESRRCFWAWRYRKVKNTDIPDKEVLFFNPDSVDDRLIRKVGDQARLTDGEI